jgi:hypothetical protein
VFWHTRSERTPLGELGDQRPVGDAGGI